MSLIQRLMNTIRKTEIETTVKAALELASAGFHVHPLPAYEKAPGPKSWETILKSISNSYSCCVLLCCIRTSKVG
jgi:hypothetical protein